MLTNHFALSHRDYQQLLELPQPQLIAILYDGRSGSVFLQSLLDSHKEVLMVPATVMRLFPVFWDRYKEKEVRELINEFCSQFSSMFDSRNDETISRLDELGPNRNEYIYADVEQFKLHLKYLLNRQVLNRRNFFIAVHYAYALCKGEDLFSKKLIIHALHIPEAVWLVKPFVEDFPDAKFVFVTRHPHATYASYYRHHIAREIIFGREIREIDRLLIALSTYKHAFYGAVTLAKFVSPQKIRAVRLEDLHLDSVATLNRLVDWLGIQFHPSLLQSTFDGKLWWGDKTIEPVNGFSKHILSKRWKQDYHWLDLYVLDFFFQDRFHKYGYTPNYQHKHWYSKLLVLLAILVPTKWELRTFLNCRRLSGFRRLIYRVCTRYRMFYRYYREVILGRTVVFEKM